MGTMCDNFIIYEDNQNEFKMWQGLVGAHYTPYVDEAGNLSWTNNGGLSNPAVVNIQGRGLTIVGIVENVSDLPVTADPYVTYLVGTASPYDGYIYDNGTWVNLGAIGVAAGFGTPTATVDSGTGTPSVTITASGPDTAKIFAFAFSNLKGAAASISSAAIEYQQGDSGTTAPSGTWESTVPSVAQGKYLWTRVTVTFNTGSPVVFYSVAYVAVDGQGSPTTFTPLADTTGGAVGSATTYARGDHQHPLNVATSGTPSADGTADLGSAATYAKTDHVHPLNVATSGTPVMDGTAALGSASTYARSDHVHPTDTSKQDSISAVGILKGNGSSVFAATLGTDYTKVNTASLTIAYANWSGSDPYTQTITISGATITANTKVDLQMDATALAQMISDGVTAMFVYNTSGTLTLYAIGAATTADITVQVTYYETA